VSALCEAHDVIFFDLDGVIYIGSKIVPFAADAIAEIRTRGIRCCFVTNNASRTATQVSDHLTELGIPASPEDVVTGSQAGAALMTSYVEPGTRVLAIGGPGVPAALADRGFVPVFSNDDDPQAVMQGFGPDVCWSDLAEASYALRRKIPWVATNLDATFPTQRGLAPGNGSLVMAVVHATGRRPDAIAGKPERALFDEAILRTGATMGLMVGDRLDTDIAGGNRAGMKTLLVLTGVCVKADVVGASGDEIPTYLGDDLRSLLAEPVRWVNPRGGIDAQ